MADDKIRRDQDDLDLDEGLSPEEGGLAELPEADDDDDFLDDEDC